jgi:hypothetical protein
LASDTTALFTVVARDDTIGAEGLTVEVIDAHGDVLPDQTPELRNGLWRVRVDVRRGLDLRIRIKDAAGNAVESNGALRLLGAEVALAGQWESRFFQDVQTEKYRWTSTWTEDSWSIVESDTGTSRSGTYSVEGEIMTQAGTGEDHEAESRRQSVFYLDGRFFSDAPFQRMVGEGDTVVGTWERRTELLDPSREEPVSDIVETLVFGEDGTWSRRSAGKRLEEGVDVDVEETESGSYTVELSSTYTAGASFYLSRQVDERDGSTLAQTEERFEFFVSRLDWLLISPYQR